MMKTVSKKGIFISITITAVFFIILAINNLNPNTDIKKETFLRLRDILEEKKQDTIDYFHDISKLASEINNDTAMLKFFNFIRDNNYTVSSDLEYEIDKHYVMNYSNFYDILFVDSTGYVFHSIKQEADYQKNLFNGALARTKLAEILKKRNDEQFVEYELYTPSDEPAAFFSKPVYDGTRHIGWFVLQCSINKVNTILSSRDNLGRTGEVYLVNKNLMMLSESRFMEGSSIFKIKIDTKPVKEAVRNNTGETIASDYRGIRVFSSYEKFDLFGVSWIIIAEIDEDEIITEFYKKFKNHFQERICDYIANKEPEGHALINYSQKIKRIDMNEFAKVKPGMMLETSGISGCTAIAILLPNRFGYLAHISPTDEIYISSMLTKIFLGDNKSDFLGELTRRIKHYDVYPYELKKLQFVIVAPHRKSFYNAVDKILGNDVELANIKFMHKPQSRASNVLLNAERNSVIVEWHKNGTSLLEHDSDIEDLSAVLKKIIEYDS